MRALRVAMVVIARDLLLALRFRFALVFATLLFVGALLLPTIAAAEAEQFVVSLSQHLDLFVEMIWVGAIAAAIWAQAIVLHRDSRDGGFEQLLLAAHSPLLILAAKAASHWLLSGLPLLAVISASAMLGSIPPQFSAFLFSSVMIGTMTMSLIAVAMVVLGVRQCSAWTSTSLFVLLLQLLVAIVAAAICHGLKTGLSVSESMLLLAGIPTLTWPLIHAAIARPLGSLQVQRR